MLDAINIGRGPNGGCGWTCSKRDGKMHLSLQKAQDPKLAEVCRIPMYKAKVPLK
jgi:hypothetical protein